MARIDVLKRIEERRLRRWTRWQANNDQQPSESEDVQENSDENNEGED